MTAMKASRPVRVMIYEPYPFGKVAGNLRTLTQILRFSNPAAAEYVLVAPFDGGFGAHAAALGATLRVLPPPSRVNQYGGQALRGNLFDRLLTALDLIRYAGEIRTFLVRERIDVIYANSVRTMITVWLGAWRAGVPVVLYIKGQLENPWLDRLALRLADRVIFFSPANRDERYPALLRRLRHKVSILEIGFDVRQLDAASAGARAAVRAELGLGRGVVMVAVGQLYAPKGWDHLIAAFSRIKDELPDLRLVIVGDAVIAEHAAYESRLRERIAREGLTERVTLTGWRDDVLAIVAECDLLVHPSLAEGFGRAVLEAMALGLPVVASRTGGLQDAIVDGVNGFLVEPRDEAALADRIRRLANDAELRKSMGGRARDTVMTRFQAADKVQRLEQIFRETAVGAA